MKDSIAANSVGVEEGVLAMRMPDAAPMGFDDGQGVDALPPEMTRIEIQSDVVADIAAERIETPGRKDGDARMHLQADHETRRLARKPSAHLLPVETHLIGELPLEQFLVIARSGPAGKDPKGAAARPCGAAAHGDDAIDVQGLGKLDGGSQATLGIVALGLVRVENIACGIDGREAKAVVLKLACQVLALTGLSDRLDIEMRSRPRPPSPNAKLNIAHPTFCTPGKDRGAGELRKGVGVYAYAHRIDFLKAEMRRAISRLACSTEAETG